MQDERNELNNKIERYKAEIKAAQEKIAGLDDKLKDKVKVAEAEYRASVETLNGSNKIAQEYADKEISDTAELEEEIAMAEKNEGTFKRI